MKEIFEKGIVMAKTLAVTIFVITLCACSGGGDKFKIDARFLNMNQANFYVYSPDGLSEGIDTIKVQGGRFTYEKAIAHEGTFVIVFPNFTSMPVFAKPGAKVSIEANAAHLKSMEISGTDENKQFTTWRKNSDNLSPAEMKKHAELFINDNPKSIVSLWLINKYFIATAKPDFKKAKAMLSAMNKALTNEEKTSAFGTQIAKTIQKTERTKDYNIGSALPRFTAKDIDGKPVTNGQLLKGHTVICVWTSWNHESLNILRQLASNKRMASDSTKIDNIITICLDADPKECRRSLKRNAATELTTICDGKMWESQVVKDLGISSVPFNLNVRDGKITGVCQPLSDLLKKK